MNGESPKRRRERKRSPYTCSVDTVLVEITAKMVPHDSPEFRERQRLAAQRPVPDYLKGDPTPNQSHPPAT